MLGQNQAVLSITETPKLCLQSLKVELFISNQFHSKIFVVVNRGTILNKNI